MAKKIAVLLDEMVDEQEFIYPYYRLKEAGFESVSVATEKRVYKGKLVCPSHRTCSLRTSPRESSRV